MSFKAIYLTKNDDNVFSSSIQTISQNDLLKQEGDTLVKVLYSSINYKDALALTNKSPVVRLWPMIAGIDCVGTIVSSQNENFKPGDTVILNGWGCGETHWGALAQYAYLKSDWLIHLPQSLTPYQSMAIGAAGYTAALCVDKIIGQGCKPQDGQVLVTGATGGVGSFAVSLLSKMGYEVVAATSKTEASVYLMSLGAKEIIDSKSLTELGKPLQKERWVAAVDTLGSHCLANVCAQIRYNGVVAACGLAQGLDFPSTVAPFILRGVTLCGVDSVMTPTDLRIKAWSMLADHLDSEIYTKIAKTITLSECEDVARQMIEGQIKGRFVVDVNA